MTKEKPEIFWGGHSKEEIPILKIINDFLCFFMYMLHFGGLTEVSIMPHIISLSYDSVLHFGGLREVSIMPHIISVSYDTVLFSASRNGPDLVTMIDLEYITKKVDTRKYCYFHSGIFQPIETTKKLKQNSIYNKTQVDGTVLICIGLYGALY